METRTMPPNGVCSSVVIRTALPTPIAQRNIIRIDMMLRGANKPKLAKMTENQNITSSNRGRGVPRTLCRAESASAIVALTMQFLQSRADPTGHGPAS